MSTQRYISTSFWDDEWIQTLDPSEKLLYLYLLTNPLTNIAGVYKISDRRISFDTGFNIETIKMVTAKFEKSRKVYHIGEYIILPSWPKHQKWETRGGIKSGIDAILKGLPTKILNRLPETGYCYPLPPTRVEPPNYHPTTPQEPSNLDSDSDSDSEFDSEFEFDLLPASSTEPEDSIFPDDPPTPKPEKSGKAATTTTTNHSAFRPPKVEEVAAYCKERSNGINPEQFVDYYSSKGWMVGKTKMKDWQAAVRTWERNEIQQPRAAPAPRDFARELSESRTRRAREIFGKEAAI